LLSDFYLFINLPPMLPATAPVPAPAMFPVFDAVEFTLRMKFPAPPA